MSANVEAKKVIVEEIKAKIQASKSIVLADYNKLTVLEVTALRNKFKEANCEYKVYKNTLVRKAFNELGVTSFDADLNGTTAIAFGEDETGASKVVADNAAKFDNKLSAKSAYVNGEYVDKAGVAELAKIPSKEALYGVLAGTLQNLIGRLAVALTRVAEKSAE